MLVEIYMPFKIRDSWQDFSPTGRFVEFWQDKLGCSISWKNYQKKPSFDHGYITFFPNLYFRWFDSYQHLFCWKSCTIDLMYSSDADLVWVSSLGNRFLCYYPILALWSWWTWFISQISQNLTKGSTFC